MIARAGVVRRRVAPPGPAPPIWALAYTPGAGQSNWKGLGDATRAPAVPVGHGLKFWQPTRTFEHCIEPVETAADPGATGTCQASFALTYAALTGEQPVMHNLATGGTAQTVEAAEFGNGDLWEAPNGAKYINAVASIEIALDEIALLGIPFEFRCLMWDQGGKDAIAIDDGVPGVTKARYKDALTNMIAAFRTDLGFPQLDFVINLLGREATGDTQGWIDVRTAQQEVADADVHVHIGFDRGRFFPDEGKMRDNVHYDQEGQNEIGRGLATYVAGLI